MSRYHIFIHVSTFNHCVTLRWFLYNSFKHSGVCVNVVGSSSPSRWKKYKASPIRTIFYLLNLNTSFYAKGKDSERCKGNAINEMFLLVLAFFFSFYVPFHTGTRKPALNGNDLDWFYSFPTDLTERHLVPS